MNSDNPQKEDNSSEFVAAPGFDPSSQNVAPQDPNTPAITPVSPVITSDKPVVSETVVTSESSSDRPRRLGKKLIFTGIIVFFAFLVSAAGAAGAYLVAYDKVSINNPELQRNISHFVMGIPGMPKSPKYVLEKAAVAHSQISKHSFDVSVATQSSDFISALGMSQLDISITGAVDYSDPEKIAFHSNIEVPNLISMQIRKPDNFIYFKVDKTPEIVLALIGLDSGIVNEAFKDWVYYDMAPLDTPAREYIEENTTTTSITQQINQEVLNLLEREEFRENVKLENSTLDDTPVYKISLNMQGADFDELVGEVSDYAEEVKDVVKYITIEAYVGRDDFLTRRIVANTQIETEGMLGQTFDFTDSSASANTTTIAAVVEFGDFQQEIVIEKPENSISVEELFARLLPEEGGIFGAINPGRQFSQARDTQRRSDLLSTTNAVFMFAAENNGLLPDEANFPTTPTCIGTAPECFDLASAGGNSPIVPTYIAAMPTDPSVGTSENTGYLIHRDTTTGRLVATAPFSESDDPITVTR